MIYRLLLNVLLTLALAIFPCYRADTAAPLTKLILTTGSLSEREGVLYVAQDQGLFRKYGMDVTLVQVRNGPVGMAALSSGESQLHWGSVSAANLGAIAEGADLVFVAGFINRLTGVFLANPKIKSPLELKGKTIGVNSLSGGAWIFSMLTLDYWGLVPERDKIQFRSLGDQSVIAQALTVGTVDAAYMGYTYGKIVQSKGFVCWPSWTSYRSPIKVRVSWRGAASSPRHHPAPKTFLRRYSMAWILFGILPTRRRFSRASSKACAWREPTTQKKVTKAWRIFMNGKSIRASMGCAMSFVCWEQTMRKSDVSKPRIWWSTASSKNWRRKAGLRKGNR
jgi:hypothetical protein